MRKLTDNDLTNIAGATIEGYHVEGVRIKRGRFSDSDHYGIILGKSKQGYYVTWEFHLDENERPKAYWGHYHMENREAAVRDFDIRDLEIDKTAVWGKYRRYLRGWAEAHGDLEFYGMSPACFDEWYDGKNQDDETNNRDMDCTVFNVTITETLRMTVEVEAEDRQAAEELVSNNWRNSEYVLDADNFVGVEFDVMPIDKAE